MQFLDRLLKCSNCGGEFIFTAGEQLFFSDKQFKNDPKRCKPCKAKRQGTLAARPGSAMQTGGGFRIETRTECSACGIETTVPFKPTQGRPVLCRQCFQQRPSPRTTDASSGRERASALAQLNSATAELVAAASGTEHFQSAALELSLPPTAQA